jgi:hypothetical protein
MILAGIDNKTRPIGRLFLNRKESGLLSLTMSPLLPKIKMNYFPKLFYNGGKKESTLHPLYVTLVGSKV